MMFKSNENPGCIKGWIWEANRACMFDEFNHSDLWARLTQNIQNHWNITHNQKITSDVNLERFSS